MKFNFELKSHLLISQKRVAESLKLIHSIVKLLEWKLKFSVKNQDETMICVDIVSVRIPQYGEIPFFGTNDYAEIPQIVLFIESSV